MLLRGYKGFVNQGLGVYLLDNQPLQDVHNKSDDSRVRGVRLDHGPHEQHRDVWQLHKLLENDGQDFLRVDLLVLEEELGGLHDGAHVVVAGIDVNVVQTDLKVTSPVVVYFDQRTHAWAFVFCKNNFWDKINNYNLKKFWQT